MAVSHLWSFKCLLLFTVSATWAFQWSPMPNGDVLHVCVGDYVTLPGSYSLSQGEQVVSINWIFDGHSQEMIAMFTHGSFVAMPTFSNRVQRAANGGLILSHVTAGDTGNYTMEITVQGGSVAIYKYTVVVIVSDGLQTTDGHLHVRLNQDAVYDNATGQFYLVLSCGQFTSVGQPPFPVEWETPSRLVVASNAYHDGHFDLHLSIPIEGGFYVCRVPQQYIASACLHGNQASSQAVITIDKLEGRLILMEAEMKELKQDSLQLKQDNLQLKQDNLQLKQDNLQLEKQVSNLQYNLTTERQMVQSLSQHVSNVDDHLADVDNNIRILQDGLPNVEYRFNNQLRGLNETLAQKIQDVAIPRIGFDALATYEQTLTFPTHVKFDSILYNQGQGFDASSGDFTAPISGMYFFTFQSQSNDVYKSESRMKVNNDHKCSAFSHSNWDHTSCHVVVHLNKGDKVWMEALDHFGDSYFFQQWDTSFAGFLINDDPP